MRFSNHSLKRAARLSMTIVVTAVVTVVAGAQSVKAQQVTIKRSFFSGWQYSTDGENYHAVGGGANDLREMMGEHRVCVSALNSYRAHSAAAKMTGLTSAFLLTFPLISNAISGEWSEGSTPMILVGLGFGVLSLTLERSGSSSLKDAVRLYNRYYSRYHADAPIIYPTAQTQTFHMSLKLNF